MKITQMKRLFIRLMGQLRSLQKSKETDHQLFI